MGCLAPGERGEKRADPVAEPGARAARPGLLNPEPEKAPPGRRVEPGVGDHAQPSLDGRKQARRRETRIVQGVAEREDVLDLSSDGGEKTEEKFEEAAHRFLRLETGGEENEVWLTHSHELRGFVPGSPSSNRK